MKCVELVEIKEYGIKLEEVEKISSVILVISALRSSELLSIETGCFFAFFAVCHAMDLIQFQCSYKQTSNQKDHVSKNVAKMGILKRILTRLQSMYLLNALLEKESLSIK